MKTFLRILKTAMLGGFCVLLPILLFLLLLGEVLDLIVALATPIADLFPGDPFENLNFPALVALALIIGTSFLLGIAAQAELGRRFGHWLESRTLARLPLYRTLKSIAGRLVEVEKDSAFKPALLVSDNGAQDFAYLIEDHGF